MAACELLANGARRGWRRRLRAWAVTAAAAALVVELAYLAPDGLLRYARDLRLLYGDRNPEYSYYLAGEFRREGFPHYFLVAMAVKSTLPALAAMLGGLGLAAASRRRWRDDLYLWLPALWWLASPPARTKSSG
jgi:hypothetical protein